MMNSTSILQSCLELEDSFSLATSLRSNRGEGDEDEADHTTAARQKLLHETSLANLGITTNSTPKPKNYIVQLIFELEHALLALHATQLTIPKLERMATFIYESMSMATRNYHSVRHVFDIINFDPRLYDQNPIAILSACFHDCVYYHVDGGLTPFQGHILKGTYTLGDHDTCENNDSLETELEQNKEDNLTTSQIYTFYATDAPHYQDDLQMVETIFGYTAGQQIRVTGDGLNEYLSAVVAIRMLREHLAPEILVQIVCCIEATIPFRPRDSQTQHTHMMQLYANMQAVTRIYDLVLSDEEIIQSVQRACILSNSDVGNFGTQDRYWFLDNTWSLLPETNESLRNEYVYSVEHFHTALYKMYGFFGFLQPEVVFHEFRGVPTPEELTTLETECRNNLALGRKYVGAKLVAMGVVSALAVLSGGDAPINLFTGDLRAEQRHRTNAVSRRSVSATGFQLTAKEHTKTTKNTADTQRRQFNTDHRYTDSSQSTRMIPHRISGDGNHGLGIGGTTNDVTLPCRSEYKEGDFTEMVYDILANGRRSKQNFDTKRSPWAALLYRYLGDARLQEILEEQQNLASPLTEDRAWTLLRSLPLVPVQTIANSIAEQALSRTDRILDIIAQLQHEQQENNKNDASCATSFTASFEQDPK